MNKLRKALLEMLFIGIAFGIVVYITTRHDNFDLLGSMLIGFVFSPAVWAIYRLGRFMFFPKRNASY